MLSNLAHENQAHGGACLGMTAGKTVFRGCECWFYTFRHLKWPRPLPDFLDKSIQPGGEEKKYESMRKALLSSLLLLFSLHSMAQDGRVYMSEKSHVEFISDAPLELIEAETENSLFDHH